MIKMPQKMSELERKILAELKECDYWAENIQSNCEEYEQKYAGIPAPKEICKITDEPCGFSSCPKRKRG